MKTFTTYATGGFVGTSEIAEILYECATGFDVQSAGVAEVLLDPECDENLVEPENLVAMTADLRRNPEFPSIPDMSREDIKASRKEDLEAFAAGLAAGGKAEDEALRAYLTATPPISDEKLDWHRMKLGEWHDAILRAAYEGRWSRFDLTSLALLPAESTNPCVVSVPLVVDWLRSLGFSPLADRLKEVFDATRSKHRDTLSENNRKPEKPLDDRERDTYLIVIAALMKEAGIDRGERGIAKRISFASQEVGAPVSDETVRKVITQIEPAIKRRDSR
jgi:hypothetical protein